MLPQKWEGISKIPWGKAPMSFLNSLQPLNTHKSPSPAISVSSELRVKHMQILLVRKVRQISTIKPCRNAIAKENQAFSFPRLQQRPFCLPIVLKMLLPFVYLSKGSSRSLLRHKLLSIEDFLCYISTMHNASLYISSMVIPYSLLLAVPELWHFLLNFRSKIIFFSHSHSAWTAFLENILRNCSLHLHHSFLKILPTMTSAKKLLCLLIDDFYCVCG